MDAKSILKPMKNMSKTVLEKRCSMIRRMDGTGGGHEELAAVGIWGIPFYNTRSATRRRITPSDATPGGARRDGEATQKTKATRPERSHAPSRKTRSRIYIYIYHIYISYIYI